MEKLPGGRACSSFGLSHGPVLIHLHRKRPLFSSFTRAGVSPQGWDDDSDDEEETDADRALMERLEAQFQAHAASNVSQRAPPPAGAPAPPPAVTVTTMPDALDLSPVRARPAHERLVRIACMWEGGAYRSFSGRSHHDVLPLISAMRGRRGLTSFNPNIRSAGSPISRGVLPDVRVRRCPGCRTHGGDEGDYWAELRDAP